MSEPREAQTYGLTKTGLEVAHEREMTEQQDRTNNSLVILTFALVLTTLVGNLPSPEIRLGGSFTVLLFVGYIVVATDYVP